MPVVFVLIVAGPAMGRWSHDRPVCESECGNSCRVWFGALLRVHCIYTLILGFHLKQSTLRFQNPQSTWVEASRIMADQRDVQYAQASGDKQRLQQQILGTGWFAWCCI